VNILLSLTFTGLGYLIVRVEAILLEMTMNQGIVAVPQDAYQDPVS
jgi:hypothetical protein